MDFRSGIKTWLRISRYILKRLLVVGVTLGIGVYAAVYVANLGGYIDDITRDRIDNAITGMILGGWLDDIEDEEERNQLIEQTRLQMEEAAGLNDPFLLRCAYWTWDAVRFKFTDNRITEAFPNTLLLFGAASLFIFAASLFLSLLLSRQYGSLLDRLIVSFSPVSSMPAWVHGVLLVMVFSVQLQWLPANVTISPFTRIIESMKDGINPDYLLLAARHMILPVAAVFLSMFFQVTYTWRTFFLIYAHEDYVDVARAIGLPAKQIERQYILKPTLPYIITNFAMVLLTFWQTSMALEYFFHWPGIGALYISSVRVVSWSPVIVMGVVTIFAFILAGTVFVLDVVYAVIDPRVRIGEQSQGALKPPLSDRWRDFLNRFRRQGRLQAAPVEDQPARRNPGRRAPLLVRWLVAPFAYLFALTLRMADAVNDLVERSARPAGSSRAAKAASDELPRAYSQLWQNLGEVLRYPSAIVGVAAILFMIGVSIYTVIEIPYQEVKALWVSDTWSRNPENARPTWFNLFRRSKLPPTFELSSLDGTAEKITEVVNAEMTNVFITYPIEFNYDVFPQDLILNFDNKYTEKHPYVSLSWHTPDGREIKLGTVSVTSSTRVLFSQDDKIKRRAGGNSPEKLLFADPDIAELTPLKGHYELRIEGVTFEKGASLDAELLVMGEVYGWAGTDHRRRDLGIALLWGTPVALMLGLAGAVLTTFISIFVAAVGVWFGGWVDNLIQAVVEINIMLPVFAIAVMGYYLYGKNVWVVVGAIILFSILGVSTKNYRAAFLQVKESAYIEGARAYGAGNFRIIFRYLAPRIVPVMVPQLVAMVPGYVFLEATLAIFGASDAYIPTWGGVIYDALQNGAFRGLYYWILEPIGLLMITGLAFALVGFAADRVFNPRLRSL